MSGQGRHTASTYRGALVARYRTLLHCPWVGKGSAQGQRRVSAGSA